jgi:uncharacterized protein DUF6851/vanadium-dependent haloperoxidase-like protein
MRTHIGCFFFTVTLICSVPAFATDPNVVVQWNQAALQGVRDSTLGPPMVARALAIVHTCMYDAWAAYDNHAIGTQLQGSLRRPHKEHTIANKNKAISFAAYRAAVDLLPGDKAAVFDPLMAQLGYDVNDNSMDTRTPVGIGNVACAAVLAFRHGDGSNQLGNLADTGVTLPVPPYTDYTNYAPVNKPSTVPVSDVSTIIDPNRWQPLTYNNGVKVVTPVFVGAQWFKVIPFALTSADQFLPLVESFGPALYPSAAYLQQAKDVVTMSAQLTDEQKMIAEYWANGPRSELPPGHWDLFAQFVSARDHHTVDQDVKVFFALTNAIFDGGIACWSAKRHFDSVRPVTAIPFLFHGQQIEAWGGPGKGTVTMDGSQWIPYQPSTFPTPPFPEFMSGHSTFSAAGAEILRLFTHSDSFGDSVTFAPGSSVTEPGSTPKQSVTLSWATFSDAADQAGISRRYGGIHFEAGDLAGRACGRVVARQAWKKALQLFHGDDDDDDDNDVGDED